MTAKVRRFFGTDKQIYIIFTAEGWQEGLTDGIENAAELFSNPHFRITNANTHCRRITNPTERPQK